MKEYIESFRRFSLSIRNVSNTDPYRHINQQLILVSNSINANLSSHFHDVVVDATYTSVNRTLCIPSLDSLFRKCEGGQTKKRHVGLTA